MTRTTCARLTFALALLAVVQTTSAQSAPPDAGKPPAIRIGADNAITATYAETPPRIDGVIDDEIWTKTQVVTDFVQLDPVEGAPPSQPSALRIAYDEHNLYFGLSFYDSDPELIRARNLERGGQNGRDDMFWLLIDTYDDDRNAYMFETNVLGTQDDAIITDESMTRSDWQWDGIYRSEGRIADDGWHVELAIPFKTIRFKNADELTMGVAIMRFLNRKGERSMWPFIPRRYSAGIFQVSQYASLEGIRNVERGRNILIKPYVIAGAQQFRVDPTTTDTDSRRDLGLDVKWAVNPNLTVDATVNTDFAQVESDIVQLDLTRFNLFYPEKREFFLERQGLFEFGDARETETFFSRRIGITTDILAGARVVGQFNRVSFGALNLQTEPNHDLELDGANNTVLRVRGDVMSRTTIGGIFTNLEQGDRFNRAFGADARSRFWGNSEISGWYTRVLDSEPGVSDAAGTVELSLRRADYGFGTQYTNVGTHFDPALGFVRRRDMKAYDINATYSPQLGGSILRSYSIFVWGNLINGQDDRKQSSTYGAHGGVRLFANDRLFFTLTRNFERLEESFFIRPDAEIPVGDYNMTSGSIDLRTDDSKFLSVQGGYSLRDYFGGTRTSYIGGFGVRTGKHLNLDAVVSHDTFELPIENGSFGATTFQMNVNFAWSRKLFAKALIQYDNFSGDLQSNIRIDWIHSPGADLFLVFNTSYDFIGADDRFDVRNAQLNNRVGVAKLTYVVQM